MTGETRLSPGPPDRPRASAPPATPARAPQPAAETAAGQEETEAGQEAADGEAAASGQEAVSARVRKLAEAMGPTTLATALLIYFGYVATRARYDYFGISLEMTGLSNQSLLLDGLEVVYVPAALIGLGTLLVVGLHAVVSWQLARRPGDVTNTFLAAGLVLAGVLLVGRAMIGMFLHDSSTSIVINPTPFALAFGPATVAYGIHVHGKNRGRPLMSPRLARNGALGALGLAVAGLFWASTQIAWAYGNGLGEEDAQRLQKRAEVILDVKEPLQGVPTGVTHAPLNTTGKDPSFAHRYRGFRLLLASGGRLFLVSPKWQLGRDQTIVVPYDNSIRIQLIPQP
ncbi:hypothetical protein [Nonomuraea sp. B19D2]|uniref:hypothetical protein n=1 Tax=Nonomuraea sp. B19D2 TaxID=3159561 RepID=UPI0032DAFD96